MRVASADSIGSPLHLIKFSVTACGASNSHWKDIPCSGFLYLLSVDIDTVTVWKFLESNLLIGISIKFVHRESRLRIRLPSSSSNNVITSTSVDSGRVSDLHAAVLGVISDSLKI